VASSWFLFFS